MAAGQFTSYNTHTQKMLDGSFDMDADPITCWLLTSSYTPNASHSSFADLTNELSHASYTGGSNGGILLTTKSVVLVSGKTYKFSSDAIAQAFASTDATCKYAVIGKRNATASSAWLMGYIDLNTSGGSITVVGGNTLTLLCPANGWFTAAGAS